jgi:FKBP-type peptidyl-prolyl cis-trans isomerase SlyD
MKAAQNKVVTVTYTLKNKNTGETIEETTVESPFVFILGISGLLPDFESNLTGKGKGDTFDFYVDAADGYGTHQEEYIVSVPIAAFMDEEGNVDAETVKEGEMLPMLDNEGNSMYGKVLEVTSENVKLDFNHELADQDLHFSGAVLEVRDATEDELAHGHVHGPNGHHH